MDILKTRHANSKVLISIYGCVDWRSFFFSVAEGVKLYNENQFKDALDYYKRAVNMDPKCAEAWYRASQV